MFTTLLFIVILLILVFVHELGHFLAAKWSKIKVTEFALGFPPKIFSWKKGETTYSLNWVPFGGFVRIHGENAEDELTGEDRDRSMVHKPWYTQVFVLVAGVTMNFLFAWLLISLAFMSGYPTAVSAPDASTTGSDSSLMILAVENDSPAEKAGLMVGDKITKVSVGEDSIEPRTSEEVINIVTGSEGSRELSFTLMRGEEVVEKNLYATSGIISDRPAIGISMGYIGVLKYGPVKAVTEGFKTAVLETKTIAVGLYNLITQAVQGQAKLSSVTGPVGIAGLVGDASEFGLAYLLGFTAFISLNLAVINLVPFPALDGGRVLVVIVEAISRRKVPAKFQLYLNGIGFTLLIVLMIVVTVGDVAKLFR